MSLNSVKLKKRKCNMQFCSTVWKFINFSIIKFMWNFHKDDFYVYLNWFHVKKLSGMKILKFPHCVIVLHYVMGMNYIWKSDAVRRGGNYFFVFLRHFSSLEDLRNEWWWTSRLKCLGHLELKIGHCNLTHIANLRRRTFMYCKLRTVTRI